ncbi:MAG: hypothetical protein CME93_09225 [Hyphomonadaceae bacterium]|nr:hypothetical protein [Hyphomonadaceae bacterium]CAI8339083.1 MAG: Uncharacterised protein [Hyphomonas sp. TMED17]
MSDHHLFPTLIRTAKVTQANLVSELEASCWDIEDGDAAGRAWSDANGYPGYTSYASLNDLDKRSPAFHDLLNQLDREAASFASSLGWDLGDATLKCDSLWINILGKDGHHPGHIHPNSVISGTCYIAVPPGAGRLKLEDPRLMMMMAAPIIKPDAKPEQKRFYYIEPKPGDIILWESWLRHEVTPHQAEDARVSISFNYSLADI